MADMEAPLTLMEKAKAFAKGFGKTALRSLPIGLAMAGVGWTAVSIIGTQTGLYPMALAEVPVRALVGASLSAAISGFIGGTQELDKAMHPGEPCIPESQVKQEIQKVRERQPEVEVPRVPMTGANKGTPGIPGRAG
jgi:hypothetical protein